MSYLINKDLRALMLALDRLKTQQNTGSAFYRSLKQSKGPNHGNRKPSPQAHSNSPVGANPSLFGARTYYYAGTITYSTPEIPNAGIRAGEIIGKRFWYIMADNVLSSLTSQTVWMPDDTIKGDVDQPLIVNHSDNTMRFAGVHAFKLDTYTDYVSQWVRGRVASDDLYSGAVEGKIKLWGTVIEHEHGYRAEHAKMISIDKVWARRPVDLYPYYTALNQEPIEPAPCIYWRGLIP